MDLGQVKAYYGRFKRWQQAPNDYEFASDAVQHCQNCGHDFTGNYCPYCSQKAGEGQISWHSVRQSFMDIWGLGSHSLPRSVWHLLVRPGYLIGDYISGKVLPSVMSGQIVPPRALAGGLPRQTGQRRRARPRDRAGHRA